MDFAWPQLGWQGLHRVFNADILKAQLFNPILMAGQNVDLLSQHESPL
jgi:hypothetical protein